MFSFWKNRQLDEESAELEFKLDKDLLEQMLHEFKNEDFYVNTHSAIKMSQVNMSDRGMVKDLIHMDELDSLLCHVEETADNFLFSEYKPSKRASSLIKALRKASLNAQIALFTLLRKQNRIQKLKGSMDADVFVTVAEFKVTVCKIFNEIFDTYDIRVYPVFRKKTSESIVFYHKQFSQK